VIARPAFARASATWDDHVPTKTEEEASFKAAQQHSDASSGRNFWNRLHLIIFSIQGEEKNW
jgi:hypothetical protein